MKGKPFLIGTLLLTAAVIAFPGQSTDGQHATDKKPPGDNKAPELAGKHDLDRRFSTVEDRLKALESRTDQHLWRAGTQVIKLENAASGTATVELKDMPKDARVLLTTKMLGPAGLGPAFKVAYRMENDGFLIYIEDFNNNNQSGLVEVDWAVITKQKASAAPEAPKSSARETSNWPGEWLFEGKDDQPCAIFQHGRVLLLVNERGELVTGRITETTKLVVQSWDNLVGELTDEGRTISWGNGTAWKRRLLDHGQGKPDEPTREELKKEVAALKELLRWQGAYQIADGGSLTVTGDCWTTKASWGDVYSGKIKIIEVREKLTVADLLVEEGATKGQTVKAILHIDGDTLHYCGTYDLERPTEFKSGDGDPQHYAWKRIKK
jgi:uncharacterized protein (TIGR03067 family)